MRVWSTDPRLAFMFCWWWVGGKQDRRAADPGPAGTGSRTSSAPQWLILLGMSLRSLAPCSHFSPPPWLSIAYLTHGQELCRWRNLENTNEVWEEFLLFLSRVLPPVLFFLLLSLSIVLCFGRARAAATGPSGVVFVFEHWPTITTSHKQWGLLIGKYRDGVRWGGVGRGGECYWLWQLGLRQTPLSLRCALCGVGWDIMSVLGYVAALSRQKRTPDLPLLPSLTRLSFCLLDGFSRPGTTLAVLLTSLKGSLCLSCNVHFEKHKLVSCFCDN